MCRKMISPSLSILFLIPILASCWNAEEIDKMIYIHSMGVDFQDNQFIVYAQFINFSYLSKESSPVAGQSQATVAVGKGDTFLDAAKNIYDKSSRRIYWGHLTSIIFTENGLKNGLKQTIDVISRYPETRYTTWLYITEAPINKVLTTYPPTELSVIFSKLGEPLDQYKQGSSIKPVKLNEFTRELYQPGYSVILPVITINETEWFDDKRSISTLDNFGPGILSKNSFNGILTKENTLGLLYIQKAERFFLSFDRTGFAVKKPKVKITPFLNDGQLRFKIDVKVQGALEEIAEEKSNKELVSMATEKIKNQIQNTYLNGLEKGADIYNLSYLYYRKHPKSWAKLQKNGKIPLAKNSLDIHVSFKIKSTLKMREKPFLQKARD